MDLSTKQPQMSNIMNNLIFKKSIFNAIESAFIQGTALNVKRDIYFLINGDLVTKTSKYTKAQQHSTGGKGSVTRYRVNGKATNTADLEQYMNSIEVVDRAVYSDNVYELKMLRDLKVTEKQQVEEVEEIDLKEVVVVVLGEGFTITETLNPKLSNYEDLCCKYKLTGFVNRRLSIDEVYHRTNFNYEGSVVTVTYINKHK